MPNPVPLDQFDRETRALMAGRTPAAVDGGPYVTQFGGIPFRDRHALFDRRHEWLIKGVLTRGEQGMLVGASQAGKSFLALDMALAIARGIPWFGCRTKRGLVVYHAGESAKGVRDKRLLAYDKAHELARDADEPFVLLTKPLDLFTSDEDVSKLLAECRHWMAAYPGETFELLVIDTFNAATPGADENAGKDVGAIRRRLKRIELELGCAVLIVHHKNAAGTKARGHGSMFADVENVLDVSLVLGTETKDPQPLKDVRGRKVRVAKVTKLKDGADEREFRFTLKSVTLGQDEDGDPVTSCVIEAPDMGRVDTPEGQGERRRIPTAQYQLLMAIEEALNKHGRPGPSDVDSGGFPVVEWRHPRSLFASRRFDTDADIVEPDPATAKKRADAMRQALKSAGEKLLDHGFIGKFDNWVWRTNKRLPFELRRAERSGRPGDEITEDLTPDLGGDALHEWLGEDGL